MKIKRIKDKTIGDFLRIEIPYWQKSSDAIGEEIGNTQNCVGVIAGDEMSISQSIDMSYKGKDSQIGMPLICFYGEREEFIKLCEELGLSIMEYPICIKCGKVIYGSHTWDNGDVCFNCEK